MQKATSDYATHPARRAIVKTFTLALVAAASLFAAAPRNAVAASVDAWPEKPITVIVPFAPGAATDVNGRRLFQQISAATGWQFVIENKPGANSIIGAEAAMRGGSDGYTLFMGGLTSHAANPNLFKKLPYDPITDFIPISRMEVVPQVVFAAPKHKINTAKELADLIAKNPGAMSYGTGSESSRAAAESFLFRIKQTGIRVPFPASTAAMTNLIGGHLDFMFTDLSAAMTLIKAGQLKPLAMVSPKRLEVLPNVPTMDELGYPGFQVVSWSMVFANKGTPAAIVDKISKAVAVYNAAPATREYFAERGGYIEVMNSEQSMAWVKAEMGRYKALYEMMGIQPQ
jgi:tripartite-type tricarboxylate transporter receptor subunit TctC